VLDGAEVADGPDEEAGALGLIELAPTAPVDWPLGDEAVSLLPDGAEVADDGPYVEAGTLELAPTAPVDSPEGEDADSEADAGTTLELRGTLEGLPYGRADGADVDAPPATPVADTDDDCGTVDAAYVEAGTLVSEAELLEADSGNPVAEDEPVEAEAEALATGKVEALEIADAGALEIADVVGPPVEAGSAAEELVPCGPATDDEEDGKIEAVEGYAGAVSLDAAVLPDAGAMLVGGRTPLEIEASGDEATGPAVDVMVLMEVEVNVTGQTVVEATVTAVVIGQLLTPGPQLQIVKALVE
jgi:hypothetical protein